MTKDNDAPNSIADLTQDPSNARRRTPRGLGVIVDSLQELGAARSIVIDENNVIIAGNGVVEAAGEAGITKVRVIDTEGDEIVAVRRKGLTAEQKIDLALRDNRANELSEWEPEVLKALSEEMDLSHLFTQAEQEALFKKEEPISPIQGMEIKREQEVVWMLLAIPVGEWPKYQTEVEKLQKVSRIKGNDFSGGMVVRPLSKDDPK